jgi:hypothetical protein
MDSRKVFSFSSGTSYQGEHVPDCFLTSYQIRSTIYLSLAKKLYIFISLQGGKTLVATACFMHATD